jgi:RNA polymerase sigma-70 factor (ECF subfamily)
MTDPELIAKFLDGDINAFNSLVWRWEKSLYNFVLRYLGDREAAKDVCQKTFIRVYQKVHGLRTPQRFSTWLYQIAVNICRDEIKSRRRQNLVSLENLQENRNGSKKTSVHPAAEQSQPEARVNQRDLRELLARALLQVPAEQRVVIVMKEYQGLKFNEIAEILQTSVNTVKSRMYYGLSALRKVFKQWKIYEEMLKYEM